jgi:hypothetical protein
LTIEKKKKSKPTTFCMMPKKSSRRHRRGPPARPGSEVMAMSSIIGSMISVRAKKVGIMDVFDSDISVTSAIENFNNNDETEPTKDKNIGGLEQKITEMSKYIAELEANIHSTKTLKAQSKADVVEEIALLKAENQIFISDLKSLQGLKQDNDDVCEKNRKLIQEVINIKDCAQSSMTNLWLECNERVEILKEHHCIQVKVLEQKNSDVSKVLDNTVSELKRLKLWFQTNPVRSQPKHKVLKYIDKFLAEKKEDENEKLINSQYTQSLLEELEHLKIENKLLTQILLTEKPATHIQIINSCTTIMLKPDLLLALNKIRPLALEFESEAAPVMSSGVAQMINMLMFWRDWSTKRSPV